jgi:hypothetical protein
VIKNFSEYLIEEEKEVYFTFGRMNPPTIGHGKVMDTLAQKSGKFDYKVYVSQTQNAKKDPLSYNDKVKHIRKMFPKHARQVILDRDVKNVFDIAVKLYDAGYTKVNMVVGADRIREFEVLLGKYNGKEARHGFYNFKSINIISAGARDPDATGVEGMSASKQRENATKNDFVAFSQGVPATMSNNDARKLFNDVRKGMGLKEEKQFKNHIELAPVSEAREQYVNGDLYSVGDLVIVKESNLCAEVSVLGANYVIIEMADGSKSRKWLDDIEPIVEKKAPQDPDIKDRKGTQPANYHKGLAKSTKAKRDAHFKKNAKKADDDKSAYKPAPGDKEAKTKPSKYTKAFKDMYDEDCWDGYKQVGMKKGRKGNQVPNCVKEDVSRAQINDLEKFADRLLNKFDIDVEFTRHFVDRMNDDRNKPAIKITELQKFFKKIAKEKGRNIKKHGDAEAVLKDMQTDLNLPVVINYKNGEFEVINKTIMRKKNFKTSSPQIQYESVDEMSNSHLLGRLASKTLKKDKYAKVAKKALELKAKDSRNHGNVYYAAEVIRKFNLSGFNARAVADVMDGMKEEINPVKIARAEIEREVESDKKRHDRILDRARLARARQKNRETK